MASKRRLQKEVMDIKSSNTKQFQDIEMDEMNMSSLQGLFIPATHPFNLAAFRIEITFPAEYPFKPPQLIFKTKINHPNVDENGNVCLSIIRPDDNWKPATRLSQIIDQSSVALIDNPDAEHLYIK
ncbi:LOW QUALITY PROTEIN: ubiquitin-conjugating enzyme E2 L5-like [Nilaparvata lugens]|uniref:LOW QUALITY PROTEIN: ubiquitin-conjugating enzyme E2 L5-like n=1 Tax=Nilaparvata lugens TaxID=108931 RepID=UPI00193E8D82|nr:LOW QUALITY PROTEIN: ubiquitin-conjugating enzyme E2 L5-like [Nilaparvata lugens]